MAEYARPSIVPGKIVGINEHSAVIADRNNSGVNWMLDYSGNIRKRPGSQIVAKIEDSSGELYSQGATGITVNPTYGAYGAGVMLRRFTGGQVVESEANIATIGSVVNAVDTHQLADEEVIIAGSEHLWRLTPAVVVIVPGSTLNGWDVSFDGTSKYLHGYLNDSLVVTTLIGWGTGATDALTLAELGLGGTTYTQLNQGALPAGYLQLTDRVHQGDEVMLSVLVWVRVPNSFHHFPFGGGAMRSSQPAPQTLLGIDDTNWNSAYFNGALYFAGRKKPLLKYDGLRAFVPGTLTQLPVPGTGAAGYTYRYEHMVPLCEQSYALNIVFDRGPPTDDASAALVTFGGLTTRDDFDIGQGVAYPIGSTGIPDLTRNFVSMPRTGNYISTSVGLSDNFVITKPDGSAHDLLPGDCIYSWNPGTSVGVWCYITHVTPTKIYLDQSVTSVATQSWSLDSVKIYRTESGGVTFYLVKEIPTYLLSSYVDVTNDATLITGTPYEEATFFPREAPTVTSAVCTHQNRLIVAHDGAESIFIQNGGQSRCLDVAISEPLSDQFAVDTGFSLEDARAREIRAMISLNDTLYLFTDRSVWYVQGSLASADSFQVHLMTEAFGAANNTSLQIVDGSIWCMTSAGQIAVIGNGSFQIIPEIARLAEPQQKNTAEISSALSLRRAQLVYDPSSRKLLAHIPYITTQRYLSRPTDYLGNISDLEQVGAPFTGVPYVNLNGTFQTLNPSTTSTEDPSRGLFYVLDFDNPVDNRPTIYKWEGLGAAGGLLATSKGIFGVTRENGVSYAKSMVWAFDEAIAHDHGTVFEMRFISPWQDLEDIQHSKRPARLQILSGTEGTQNFALSVKTEIDWLNSVYVDEFTAEFKVGEGYDELPYDTAPYGDPNEALKVFPLSGQRTKAIRLSFSNSDRQQMPTISGWSYELANNETNTKET